MLFSRFDTLWFDAFQVVLMLLLMMILSEMSNVKLKELNDSEFPTACRNNKFL